MNIRELFDELGIAYVPEGGKHTRPGWIQFKCPHCQGDPYAGFNTVGNYINCWRCGKKEVASTLALASEWPVGAVRDALRGLVRVGSPALVPQGILTIPGAATGLQTAHNSYLRGRGFNPKTLVRLWDISGIGPLSPLKWRLFIPIYYCGQMVSWTTRSISDTIPSRYISAAPAQETINHKRLIYGADYCRHEIIVVEGPTDVWRIGPGAGATMGLSYSRAQLAQLSKYTRVTTCFDNEPEAQRRARRLAELLAVLGKDVSNVVLDAADPGSAKPKEIKKLRQLFLGDN